MISQGKERSENIIIDNSKGCFKRFVRRTIINHNNIAGKHPIKELWIYEEGKLRMFYKEGVFYKTTGRPV